MVERQAEQSVMDLVRSGKLTLSEVTPVRIDTPRQSDFRTPVSSETQMMDESGNARPVERRVERAENFEEERMGRPRAREETEGVVPGARGTERMANFEKAAPQEKPPASNWDVLEGEVQRKERPKKKGAGKEFSPYD